MIWLLSCEPHMKLWAIIFHTVFVVHHIWMYVTCDWNANVSHQFVCWHAMVDIHKLYNIQVTSHVIILICLRFRCVPKSATTQFLKLGEHRVTLHIHYTLQKNPAVTRNRARIFYVRYLLTRPHTHDTHKGFLQYISWLKVKYLPHPSPKKRTSSKC